MTPDEAKAAAVALLAELLERGSWYISAIELDHVRPGQDDGEDLRTRAESIVKAAQPGGPAVRQLYVIQALGCLETPTEIHSTLDGAKRAVERLLVNVPSTTWIDDEKRGEWTCRGQDGTRFYEILEYGLLEP